MKSKIIATVLALGMVLTAFSMFAAADPMEAVLSRVSPAADGQRADTGAAAPNALVYFWAQNRAWNPTVTVSHWGVNAYGVTVDGVGSWVYNLAYTQCTADTGSIWDAWSALEDFVMVYEIPNTLSANGRNYTMIFEDQMDGDGSTNAGANSAQNAMTVINNPTETSNNEATNTAVIGIVAQVTGYETPQLYDGYGLYKSTTGPITATNPGTFVADITTTYTDTAWTADAWYAVKVKWDGSSTDVFIAPRYSYGYSQNLFVDYVVAGNDPPVVTVPATVPAVHNGNTVTEFVTIGATITDLQAADVLSATYSVDGGAPVAFAQTGVSPLVVSAVYNFPSPYTEGAHTVSIVANDGTVNSVAPGAAPFTVTDTTAPLAAWDTVPGATAFWTNDIVFTASYEDFSTFQAAGSYLTWSLNAVPQANIPFVMTFDGFGSFLYTATATIPAGTGAAGDVITYGGQVTAASATPQTTPLAAGGPITLADPPVLTDPFPVFGTVVLYDGAAGVYSPNLAPINTPVAVGYFDFALGAWNVIPTVTDALGQYTVDIMNVVVGDPAGIEVAAGPFPGYNNMGYAWVPVVAAYAVGGVQVDVTCGVPAEVIITVPLTLSNVIAGTPFIATYTIVDIDGVLAQGYYTFEGQMLWTSSDVAFVAPAGRTFNGIATATPGTATDSLTLWTPPQQTIRIGENGLLSNDMPSSLGDYGPINIGGVSTPVFTDDWDEIILNIMGNSFDWNVVDGWNIVSVPMDPVFKGGDGVFGAFDALATCNALMADPTLVVAMRDNAGVYTVADLAVAEGTAADFAMDGVHGYWVYSETVGGAIVNFLALDYAAVGFNTVNAVAGWNLLGFTHNFGTGTWNVAGNLDADYLTTALPGVGMTTKIIATEWDYTAQWYYSYVVTPTFVMPSRNWGWDFSYSAMPGNGFYLWLDAAAAITFPMDY